MFRGLVCEGADVALVTRPNTGQAEILQVLRLCLFHKTSLVKKNRKSVLSEQKLMAVADLWPV